MSDIYRIACRLTFETNAAGVLGMIAGHLTGLDAKILKTAKGFEGLTRAKLAFFGGAGIAAGAGIFAGLASVAKHGEEILDQQSKMIRAGRTHAEVARLTADAYGRITKAVPTASAADVLRATNQIATVTGDMKSAEKWAPFALKTEALIANLTGAKAEGAGHDILRALEMRGLTAGTDAEKAIGQKLAEAMVADIAASGGKLTSRDFATMAKRGGAFYSHLSPEFIAGAGAVLAADMGGDTAGTTLATAGMFFSGAGTMSKQQFEALRAAHMIDMSKVSIDKGGRVNAKAGAIVGSDLAMTNPFEWVQRVLLPHLHRQRIKDGSPEMEAALSKIGRNRNTIRELTMFSSPEFVAQIHKDIELFRKAMGLDKAYDDYVKNDPKGVRASFDKQYDSMMSALGAPLMQAAIPVMQELTTFFNKVGALANAHPEVVKGIGIGLAVLGGALIGAGGAALIAAVGSAGGILLGIGAGIGAIGAAVVGLAAFKPDILSQIASGLTTMDAAIDAFFAKIKQWVAVIPGMLGPQFKPAVPKDPNEAPSLTPEAYEGASPLSGGQLIKAALGGDDSGGKGRILAGTIAGGISNSNVVILGGGTGGDGGGLGGFGGGRGGGHWGGGMMPIGSGAGPGHSASQADRAAFIRAYAAKIGIDPNTALRVAQSEGFYKYTGDGGRSFGDWQLFTGGGLGNIALKHGLNIRDPKTWKQQTIFALNWAREHGWGDWHGAAKVGIGNHQGIGRPPAPTVKREFHIHNHNTTALDGKTVARVVTKHQVAEMRHAGGLGTFDDHGMRIAGGQTMHSV